MYRYLAMVDPAADITPSQVAERLRRKFADTSNAPEIVQPGEHIALRWLSYELRVAWSALPHVVEESRDIADRFAADHPARDRIAQLPHQS